MGKNSVKIDFIAGNGALNRNENYMYTLFVPDRMRTSIPSFDQPNLKATFDLELVIPRTWKAISSAPIKKLTHNNEKSSIKFETSNLMSTYLFSFVAGRFEEVIHTVDGFEMTMLHREPDIEKVARNIEEIFKLHKASIDYMEDYTEIKFPFKKFGFALIPSFQFGGMEHIGAIQYNASTLMLDENPPTIDLLARASLIGHETAHMWFGDLVTMEWFNDVWTKEVFANFMSAKLVNPSFPNIDHKLRSHLRLHPGAYAVDRSEGPNPIRQELLNLDEAGSLYGAIIYNKAPIMMQQLETILQEDVFRNGIREYLKTYAHKNATWPNLIEILDKRTQTDLKEWSDVWVNTPGRPTFALKAELSNITLIQEDPRNSGRLWPQSLSVKSETKTSQISSETKLTHLDTSNGKPLLFNADGTGYGLFPVNKNIVKDHWFELTDLDKASAIVNLFEQLMEGNGSISPREYITLIEWAINLEQNPLIVNHLMRQLENIYWSLLTPSTREEIAPSLENNLWKIITDPNSSSDIKKAIYNTYIDIAISKNGIKNMKDIWQETLIIDGLYISDRDYINLASFLAIKSPSEAETILDKQATLIESPDEKRRFDFIRASLSPDIKVRDDFFNNLKDAKNRYVESWVLTSLENLHHPFRLEQAEKYILPSLELLQEIQITGDIFFPGRWISAILNNYQSNTAIKTVREFLINQPNYNHQLKLKILQGADQMFRANRILMNEI